MLRYAEPERCLGVSAVSPEGQINVPAVFRSTAHVGLQPDTVSGGLGLCKRGNYAPLIAVVLVLAATRLAITSMFSSCCRLPRWFSLGP